MKSGGSKQKGAHFERTICKQLSLWVSGNERTDIFWRSAMSGGRATLALRRGEVARSQAGDISGIHPLGHKLVSLYAIECKHYKDLQIRQLVTANKGNLADFWNKAISEAAKHSKEPWLIAKQNHIPALLCLRYNAAEVYLYLQGWGLSPMCEIYNLDLMIYLWDDFLAMVGPEALEE